MEEMLTCTVAFPFATSFQEIKREFWISRKVLRLENLKQSIHRKDGHQTVLSTFDLTCGCTQGLPPSGHCEYLSLEEKSIPRTMLSSVSCLPLVDTTTMYLVRFW